MTVGLAELTLRLSLAWPQYVAQQVQHRPALWGIAHAHVAHTRKWLRTLMCRAAFVKILNGAHITQDGKQHCDANGSSICPWCESSDSRFHRFWICPRFEAIRDAFPSKFQRALPDLPESLTSYGWSLKPHTLRPWLTYFAQIPAPARPPIESLPSLAQPWVHIFTDGSCVQQHCSIQRYAAWSCLIAGDDPHCCAPLWERAGPLPGLVQSAYRAEVFAVIQALEVGQVLGRPIHVWTDCQAVVVQTRAIVQGRQVSPNHAHADLWTQVQQLATNGRIPALRITKVSSHEDTHTLRLMPCMRGATSTMLEQMPLPYRPILNAVRPLRSSSACTRQLFALHMKFRGRSNTCSYRLALKSWRNRMFRKPKLPKEGKSQILRSLHQPCPLGLAYRPLTGCVVLGSPCPTASRTNPLG